MIQQESRYWKIPLLRAATWLERVRIQELTSEGTYVRIERELFIGFYTIRKLLDTFKVSASTRNMAFQLRWSPCIKMVDYMNAHKIDELFELEIINSEERDLEFLCNQFIHSYVFVPVQNEDGTLAGLYVSSDRAKTSKLYFVDITQVLHAFRTVGKDYPKKQHMRRNEKTLQWEEVVE